MTKQEILDALEGLKELTNNSGKLTIDGIKAGIWGLSEPPVNPLPVEPQEHVDVDRYEVFHPLNVSKKKAGKK